MNKNEQTKRRRRRQRVGATPWREMDRERALRSGPVPSYVAPQEPSNKQDWLDWALKNGEKHT